MKKYNFNKLIRSNLPERMKKEGVALILVARKASYPQALMKPYRKGER